MKQKEVRTITLAILLVAIAIGVFSGILGFITTLIFVAITFLVNIIAKKIASYYLDSKIEFKFWQFERYGYRTEDYLKKPIPLGAILALIFGFLTFGAFKFLALLEYDVKPTTYRSSRRFGLYSFSEMTEWHIGLIAFWGIIANLAIAVVAYLIGSIGDLNLITLAKLNIYLAVYSIIPFSNLDGSKILFGSKILWSTAAVIVLIAISYVFLL